MHVTRQETSQREFSVRTWATMSQAERFTDSESRVHHAIKWHNRVSQPWTSARVHDLSGLDINTVSGGTSVSCSRVTIVSLETGWNEDRVLESVMTLSTNHTTQWLLRRSVCQSFKCRCICVRMFLYEVKHNESALSLGSTCLVKNTQRCQHLQFKWAIPWLVKGAKRS